MTSLVSILIAGKTSFLLWDTGTAAPNPRKMQTRSLCVMLLPGEVMSILPVLSEEVPADQSAGSWQTQLVGDGNTAKLGV